jgi:hypothetical protein
MEKYPLIDTTRWVDINTGKADCSASYTYSFVYSFLSYI